MAMGVKQTGARMPWLLAYRWMPLPAVESGKGRDTWEMYVSGSTGHRRHTWWRGCGGSETDPMVMCGKLGGN